MLFPKPHTPLPDLLPNPPNPASLLWHSPVLGHMIFLSPRASPPIDGRLSHTLLHMQLETQLWGILVSSYSCSSYRVVDTFSSLGTFSSSSRGRCVPSSEHPLLYLSGTGIASQVIAISWFCQQNLTGICNSVWVWWFLPAVPGIDVAHGRAGFIMLELLAKILSLDRGCFGGLLYML
jgi:hypothetical protein